MNKAQFIDLDKGQLGLLESIIKSHIPDKTVWAYGSRVAWKAGEASDLDLAVFGCSSTEIFDLKEAFEESDLLMSVDVMNWETIPEKFKENIRKKHVVLQEKQELTGWRRVRLGEISRLNYGKSLPKQKRIAKDIPVYSSAGLIGYHNKALAASKGLIIGRKGNIGSVYKSNIPFFPIDTTFYISKDDTNCDLDYLFYRLSSLGLPNLNSDSAVPGLNRNTFYTQKIMLPPLPEQKAIAEVLSSLDDKIDNLRRQNKTLEDMAQTLFRQWFIEEADESWEKRRLCEIANFAKGRKPKRTESVEFQGSELQILIETFDTSKTLYAEREKMVVAHDKDILMVMDGASSGRVEIGFEGVLGSTIGLYRPLDNFKYPFFIFCFLKSQEKYIKENTTGSAIPHVDNRLVLGLMLHFPDIEKVSEFESTVESFFAKKQSNKNQICTHEKQRDSLLPKLIGGKVRVTCP